MPLRLGARPAPAAWAALTDDERSEATRYRDGDDRLRFVTARALLRGVLAPACSLGPPAVPLRRAPSGRLELVGSAVAGRLHFSVTHAGAWVSVAVAPVPVGVDVEAVSSDALTADVLRGALTGRERELLLGRPEGRQARDFARLWTRKEAVMKGAGVVRMSSIDVSRTRVTGTPPPGRWHARNLDCCGDDYAFALAAPGRWTASLYPAGVPEGLA